MKRYIYLTLMLVAVVAVNACDDDAPHNMTPSLKAHYLNFEPSSIEFSYEASTRSDVYVESVSSSWRLKGMADWLSFTPSDGNGSAQVSVSVTENPSASDVRTCFVEFCSDDEDFYYYQSVYVTQAKAIPYVTVADADRNITFDAAGGSKSINVSTNMSGYSVSGIPEWFTVAMSADAKTLTITASANESTKERTPQTIYLDGSVAIKVMQRAASVTVTDGGTITADKDAKSYGIKVTSDVPWTASNNGYSWINITPSGGDAGTTDVLLSVASNSSVSARTGRVTFRIGSDTACEITVEQEGLVLNVSPESVTFDADACSRTVNVESNTKWKVLSKPEWITVQTETFEGDSTLTMSAADYNLMTARTGEVVIGIEGVSLTRQIAVTQNGRKFDNLVSTLNFTAAASSQSFTVTTDGTWTAETSEQWVTLSGYSGKGTSEITVSVAENTADTERTARVTVSVGGTSQTVLVVQAAHYLTITPTSINALESTGGSHTIQVSSDGKWTARKQASWLTVTPTSGTGDISVKITAADNPSVNARKDTVVITPQYGQAVRVVVLQKARYLKVSAREISFFYEGGESEPVTVETDGTYKVSTSDSWLSISENGSTFTVTATENSTEDKREGEVTVELTRLVADESYRIDIPVVQHPKTGGPAIEDFSDDEDWNIVGGTSHAVISIRAFGDDENWNSDTGSTEFRVTITGYDEDADWNELIR